MGTIGRQLASWLPLALGIVVAVEISDAYSRQSETLQGAGLHTPRWIEEGSQVLQRFFAGPCGVGGIRVALEVPEGSRVRARLRAIVGTGIVGEASREQVLTSDEHRSRGAVFFPMSLGPRDSARPWALELTALDGPFLVETDADSSDARGGLDIDGGRVPATHAVVQLVPVESPWTCSFGLLPGWILWASVGLVCAAGTRMALGCAGLLAFDTRMTAIVLCVSIGAFWLALIPPFEAADEPDHYDYARYIAHEGRLPHSVPSSNFENGFYTYERIQEPLFYLVASRVFSLIPAATAAPELVGNPRSTWRQGREHALFERGAGQSHPTRVALLVIRLANVGAWLITLLCVYRGVRFLGGSTLQGACVVVVLALIPSFGVVHATANNDPLVTTLATGAGLVALGVANARRAFFAGLLVGLALVTKLTAVPIAVATFVRCLLGREDWPDRVRLAAAVTCGVAISAGWNFVRNWLVFGDPAASRLKTTLAGYVASNRPPYPLSAFDPRYYLALMEDGLQSFWSALGWTGIGPSALIWSIYGLMTVVATVFVVVGIRASVQRRDRIVLTCVIGPAIALMGWVAANTTVVANTARYFYPTVLPVTLLAWSGATTLLRRAERRGAVAVYRHGLGALIAMLVIAWIGTAWAALLQFHAGL